MKISRIIVITLLVFTGLNALIAGFLFMYDSSGDMMGLNTDYIGQSPFSNYFWPGLVLFMFNGLLNLFVAYWSIKKGRYYAMAVIIQGIVLMGWILVQVIMVHEINTLHTVMFSIGSILFLLGVWINKQITSLLR